MTRRWLRWIFLLGLAALVVGVGFSALRAPAMESPAGGDLETINPDELPPELRRWVDDSRRIMAGQTRVWDEVQFILATYGTQPTGGYGVEIEDVVHGDDLREVTVRFNSPDPEDFVTQVVTYPFHLIAVPIRDVPVAFVARGDEERVPTLQGIDHLEPVVAATDRYLIFTPGPGDTVEAEFLLEGVANTFEGTVNYDLMDESDRVLLSGWVTGAQGDWGYFKERLSMPPNAPGNLTLRLYVENAEDGRREHEVTIPFQWLESRETQ